MQYSNDILPLLFKLGLRSDSLYHILLFQINNLYRWVFSVKFSTRTDELPMFNYCLHRFSLVLNDGLLSEGDVLTFLKGRTCILRGVCCESIFNFGKAH